MKVNKTALTVGLTLLAGYIFIQTDFGADIANRRRYFR